MCRMCLVSKGISSRKTIAPFCSTSPPQMIFCTPTCHTNSEKRFSACRHKEIKGAFIAIIAIPKPTLKLSSSNPLKRLRLYHIFTFKQPSYYQCLNMQKPQGERSNSRAGWGKVQLPKGHSCAETSQTADTFWQLNISRGGTNGNRHDIAGCLHEP